MNVFAGLKRCWEDLPVWSHIRRNTFFIWQYEFEEGAWVIQPNKPMAVCVEPLLLPKCVTVCAPYCKVKSRFALVSGTVGSPDIGTVSGCVPEIFALSLFWVWCSMVEVKLVACWWPKLIILWTWIPAVGFTSTANPFLVVSLEIMFWLNWGGWRPHCGHVHASVNTCGRKQVCSYPVHHTRSNWLKFCKGVSPSDVESRSHSNETPIETMLELNRVGFSSEIGRCVGRASGGGWKKEGRSKEMWFFWDWKVAPKWS